jgi:hypothetical protein
MISVSKIWVVGVFVAGGAIAVGQWFLFGTAPTLTVTVEVPDGLQPEAQVGKAGSMRTGRNVVASNAAGPITDRLS